ncbi:tRNA 2-selenouridine(34) synthase MnmH [Palleronia caenipelagi]|uniref:tRNA 2-selenouridine(34) synthase MnmH n=1 Tax=Palleronia caenipelagi TaxID=2489174 RepID=A0A547QA93_9RHOB|nr:tRNA 2-selenouridine(34) synthase MnmH [Palleronia caenipelagi]TRD23337.1 tRNA 2-selenouridine(34) synthase MnmH [Palleronia caenipelagi]
MPFVPSELSDITKAGFNTIIDVRAPSEFAEDHIPGAINLPVLDDSERARVGTIYVQQSAFLARKIGAALVSRNAARHIEGPLAEHEGDWRPLVYCWRGGQRSNSFASILSQIGWRVSVLEGGYQSYRRLVKARLYDTRFPSPVILLDGNTGTAKTAILHAAEKAGAQVIDLEGLANHRGSLFGAQGVQPSQKAFESALAARVAALDPDRPVFIEAESSKIGERIVPPALWSAMRTAPRVVIEAELDTRASYLVRAYKDAISDPARLDTILQSMLRLQGHERVTEWRNLAEAGDMRTLAKDLMEHHYDPRYDRQRHRQAWDLLGKLKAEMLDTPEITTLGAKLAGLKSEKVVISQQDAAHYGTGNG